MHTQTRAYKRTRKQRLLRLKLWPNHLSLPAFIWWCTDKHTIIQWRTISSLLQVAPLESALWITLEKFEVTAPETVNWKKCSCSILVQLCRYKQTSYSTLMLHILVFWVSVLELVCLFYSFTHHHNSFINLFSSPFNLLCLYSYYKNLSDPLFSLWNVFHLFNHCVH